MADSSSWIDMIEREWDRKSNLPREERMVGKKSIRKRKIEFFSRGLLPHKKEIKLLQSSDVLNDYDKLKQILDKHKTINKRVFDSLPYEEQKYLRSNVLRILRLAQKEWFILENEYKDLGENWNTLESKIYCELCGEELRHVHQIQKHGSDQRFVIGGTCKDDFNTKNGISGTEIEVKRRELFRSIELGKKFDGIIDVIQDSDQIFDSLELMIPERLKKPYNQAAREVAKEYKRYISGKIDTTIKLRPTWELFCNTRHEMVDYNEEHKANPWKVTRKIENNFRASSSDYEIGLLNKENCTITPLTLYRIKEPTFLKALIPYWNHHLLDIGIKINHVSQESPAYIYSCFEESDLDFVVSYKDFAKNFGNILFGEVSLVELTTRNVVIQSSTYCTPQAVRKILDAIKGSVSVLGLEVEGVYEDTNRVIFFDTDNRFYLQTNTNELVENTGSIVLFQEDGLNKLKDYLQGSSIQKLTAEQLRLQKEAGWAFQDEQRRHRR